MDCDMMIYESREYRLRNPDDAERFDRSHAILEAAGIRIGRVVCTSIEDIDPDGEAHSIVSENGINNFPITWTIESMISDSMRCSRRQASIPM